MSDDLETVVEDGTAISFSVEGDGPPLVLLSGQGTTRQWWDRAAPVFAAHHTVIRCDYRGTGRSRVADGAEYSTRQFARDAVAVLDHLGIRRAHIYGTSMGGKIAQWIAADHPDRLDRLVLGCTSEGGPDVVHMDRRTALAFGATGAEGQAARVPLMYSDAWLTHHDPNPAVVSAPATQRARIGHRRASQQHDTSHLLARIHAPVLVLHGEDDAVVPPVNAERLAARLPRATIRTFPDARHAYFEECLAEAADAVLHHLAGTVDGR